MNPGQHVTGMVSKSDDGVGSGIVEEMGEGMHGGLGAISLSGSQGAKSYQHGVV